MTKKKSTRGKGKKASAKRVKGSVSVALCLLLAILGVILGTNENDPLGIREFIKTNILSETSDEPAGINVDGSGITASDIPSYAGKPYVAVNENEPFFTADDLKEAVASYETYSDLDSLKRCGPCEASVGKDIMPTEDRGEIGSVKPSGWVQEKYPGIVDGNYLYNRCHLIGYQLTGENANPKNLITGTRYLNVDGMLPFENMVADYVKETGNHVLYRVTPIFDGDNLVAAGVLMEAKSVEDDGDGVLYCVFCYNVQPGIVIDYSTGKSHKE